MEEQDGAAADDVPDEPFLEAAHTAAELAARCAALVDSLGV